MTDSRGVGERVQVLEVPGDMRLVAETVRPVLEHFGITGLSVPKSSMITPCKLSQYEGLHLDTCKSDCAPAVYASGNSGADTSFELDAR